MDFLRSTVQNEAAQIADLTKEIAFVLDPQYTKTNIEFVKEQIVEVMRRVAKMAVAAGIDKDAGIFALNSCRHCAHRKNCYAYDTNPALIGPDCYTGDGTESSIHYIQAQEDFKKQDQEDIDF